MKSWILTIAVLLVAATGCLERCEESSIVVSAMTATDPESPQNESVIRLGLEQELVTIGLQSHLIGIHGEDQFFGVYMTSALDINDVALLGQPYFGYQAGLPTEDEDGGFHGPLLGTRYSLSPNVESFVEGWFRAANGPLKNMNYFDEWKALAGIRYRF